MSAEKKTTVCFGDLKINGKILSILSKKKFSIPTPIQHQVIPGALDGKDVVGIAQTGTGKTLAFGIPMIQRLIQNGGQGLILVPTRELASQVEEAFNNIGESLGLRCAVVMGGIGQYSQVKALKRNPHVVIATPGRLDDLMKQNLYKLDRVKIITLDEADRMLDVGFLPQIRRMLNAAPKNRQTMLFSATMPKSISSLASEFMKRPLRIEVAPQGTSAKNVEQELFIVAKIHKMRLLKSLLKENEKEVTLIFSRTKYGARNIAKKINAMGYSATEIHSNRSQPQRRAALDGFSNGKYRIMVATDIAARGIDVKEISLVINYDLPSNSEDYVHRIGRTGRAGRYGKAISFASGDQTDDVKKIEKLIRKTLPLLTHPSVPKDIFVPKSTVKARPFKRKGPARKHRGGSSFSKYKKKNSSHNSGR